MDLIDRKALLIQIEISPQNTFIRNTPLAMDLRKLYSNVIELAPTVDAEPVRRGRNENREYHEADEFICSECGLHLEDWTRYVYDEYSDEEYAQEYVFKHCPECGARIVGE